MIRQVDLFAIIRRVLGRVDLPALVLAACALANLLLVFGLFRQGAIFGLVFKVFTRCPDFIL